MCWVLKKYTQTDWIGHAVLFSALIGPRKTLSITVNSRSYGKYFSFIVYFHHFKNTDVREQLCAILNMAGM